MLAIKTFVADVLTGDYRPIPNEDIHKGAGEYSYKPLTGCLKNYPNGDNANFQLLPIEHRGNVAMLASKLYPDMRKTYQ